MFAVPLGQRFAVPAPAAYRADTRPDGIADLQIRRMRPGFAQHRRVSENRLGQHVWRHEATHLGRDIQHRVGGRID
eukprot:3437422-Rhodomonas_salina.2